MERTKRIWLVANDASGSNDEQAREELEQCCGNAGFHVERMVGFPAEDLPDAAALDAAGIELLAVFAGDGTTNAVIGNLAGWGGAVLVLPGGTMNLLYHRLHGERTFDEVIHMAAAGRAARRRPGVIRCGRGTAYVDLLAGPGTSWYEVREAMRESDVLGVAESAANAIGETLATAGIVCRDPALGREEGYPLVMLTPEDEGIRVSGYYAETIGDYLKEGMALLARRFRDGPHDDLGTAGQVTLESSDGGSYGILMDGEKVESPAAEVFRLVPCEVDLLATE
ncbi:diacylglycerol kinase [Altererythrobacter soli]|uniref:Diacylglycerol kinase n=1 Tax=Croceibacterium soli TaxID=1739690 RepID=A0A6I4UST7_9SPHN|nr:diacylglycerol kinase family protein [Croceibacterium soli]MXP40215.1 diacylglycerol kinase [Croceibacterium soli]